MQNIISTTLVVLASTTIVSAGSVQAQYPRTPNQQTEDFTISGDSLEGIENRTVEGDYRQFFGGNAATNRTNRINESYEMNRKGGRGLLQVGSDAELQINRQTPEPVNAIPFRDSDRQIDSNRVELKLDLGQ
jgi:hypothetical protein